MAGKVTQITITRRVKPITIDLLLALQALLIGALVGEVTSWGFMSFGTLGLILLCLLVAAYRCKLCGSFNWRKSQ